MNKQKNITVDEMVEITLGWSFNIQVLLLQDDNIIECDEFSFSRDRKHNIIKFTLSKKHKIKIDTYNLRIVKGDNYITITDLETGDRISVRVIDKDKPPFDMYNMISNKI